MIEVHHLERSRSRRIVWLLEELGAEYRLTRYERDPVTQRAPASLAAVHPLGKSPVLVDGDVILCESGAIVEYLLARYGDGQLAPASTEPSWPRYVQWLHFAEGSAMFPLLLEMFLGMLGGTSLDGTVGAEVERLVDFLEGELSGDPYFAGEAFTAADVLMTFVLEFAEGSGKLEGHPALEGYLARVRERPAHGRAAAVDAERG